MIEQVAREAKKVVTRKEFVDMREARINSPFNRWVAGETCRHTPDHFERTVHFVLHGGLSDLAREVTVRNG